MLQNWKHVMKLNMPSRPGALVSCGRHCADRSGAKLKPTVKSCVSSVTPHWGSQSLVRASRVIGSVQWRLSKNWDSPPLKRRNMLQNGKHVMKLNMPNRPTALVSCGRHCADRSGAKLKPTVKTCVSSVAHSALGGIKASYEHRELSAQWHDNCLGTETRLCSREERCSKMGSIRWN